MSRVLGLVVVALLVTQASIATTPPSVTNVKAVQKSPNSNVDIYYDLNSPDTQTLFVSVKASSDGGNTYTIGPSSLSGDVGAVSRGTGKHIVWKCGKDLPGTYSTNYRVSVAARAAVADSVADFCGTQGYNGWYYGYYTSPFDGSHFQLMPLFGMWFGRQQWYIDPDKFWTSLWVDGTHPNKGSPGPGGTGPGTEQWPVRRWVSTIGGSVRISGQFYQIPQAACGDGAALHIYADGVELWSQWVSGYDAVGVNYSVTATCHVGSIIDFAQSPGPSDGCDHYGFAASISPTDSGGP